MYPLIILILILPAMLWKGLATKILWGWFAVPFLHVPEMTIGTAAGLTLLLSFVTAHPVKQEKTVGPEALSRFLVLNIVAPPMALLFGWLILMVIK